MGLLLGKYFEWTETWTKEKNKTETISSLCYVAVIEAGKHKFVSYPESSTREDFLTDANGEISNHMDKWIYSIHDGHAKVRYEGDDYGSYFEYQVAGYKIVPISCKVNNPAYYLSGFFYSFLVISTFSILSRFLIFLTKKRQSSQSTTG